MSKPEQSTVEPSQSPSTGPFASVVGTVIGGVLGLIVLVLLVSLLEKTPTGPVEELPHAVVMVELGPGDTLVSGQARSMLVALQRRLKEAGLAVSGPADYAILVPGADRMKPPQVKPIDQLLPEEFERAAPYLASGGWLVPRIYSPDLTQAVIRVGPPGTAGFPPGSAAAIKRAIEPVGTESPGARAWLYSRALGLEDEEARNRINITFGVQTAPVHVRSPEGKLGRPDAYTAVQEALAKLKDSRLRSTATLGSFATYAGSVLAHNPAQEFEPSLWDRAMALGRQANLPQLIDGEGKNGVIDVTTEAEGKANLEVANMVAAHAQGDGFNAYVARNRR